MVEVETFCILRDGLRVFVQAEVTDSVEVKAVLTGDDCDAIVIPMDALGRDDLRTLEEAANEEAYRRERERRGA